MITIAAPTITSTQTRARLSATITEETNGVRENKTLYYEVDARYKNYLNDRSDAFVVGLFFWAMAYQHDITCEAPLTERLHFQLEQTLGPILAHHSTRIHAPKIFAPLTAEPLPTAGAVGTGCSAGIDSFHAITNHVQSKWSSLKLTHLCTFSVGHLGERVDAPDSMSLVDALEHRATMIAQSLGLESLHLRSNYSDLFQQDLLRTVIYADMQCVHALGKLFSTYFFASDGECHFSLEHRECACCSHYDIVSLPCLSTPSLMLYPEGPATMRWKKTEHIATHEIVHQHLNVCNQEFANLGASDGISNRNCGICNKCIRTLFDLEVAGRLDEFKDIFDIVTFRTVNRRRCLRWLLAHHLAGDVFVEHAWQHLHNEIQIVDYLREIKAVLRCLRTRIRGLLNIKRVPRFKDPRKLTHK